MPLPAPRDRDAPVKVLVDELVTHLGERATVEVCVALLRGADRVRHEDVLVYLTGIDSAVTADRSAWHDYWVRTWGARGLLYAWDDAAGAAVVDGLADEHWRPAEMCLKVATKREVGPAGDGAVRLSTHDLPRVRAQAMRTLGAVGDTEHVDAVRAGLDDDHVDVRRQAVRALERLRERLDLGW